ncbi:MAG: Zn-ribbon domain-containing OB-fold protein [Burkholderiales bacterium]|nr:Zn-ribbon domain-containing OB-fold protein [Burkholderiales bacterium]
MANESGYPAPVPNADSKPYWEAATREELVLKRCSSCGKHHFPPRHLCPACWSDKLEWTKSAGTGVVYTFTIMQRAPMPVFAQRVPYVVALVDLEEGPRMMANIVGDDALQTTVGERVHVCFEERAGGAKLPQFRRGTR